TQHGEEVSEGLLVAELQALLQHLELGVPVFHGNQLTLVLRGLEPLGRDAFQEGANVPGVLAKRSGSDLGAYGIELRRQGGSVEVAALRGIHEPFLELRELCVQA